VAGEEARAVAQVLREITSSRPGSSVGRRATDPHPDPGAILNAAMHRPKLDLALLAVITEDPFEEEGTLRRLIADALHD
jgi:hypothetical protein